MLKKQLLVTRVLCMIALGLTVISPAATSFAQEDVMEITRNKGYTVAEKYRPKASVVIDAETGKIAWEENIDDQRNIASLSKLMTIYLALEAIEAGKFNLDTTMQPNEKIVNISNIYSLSNNKMMAGVDYSISDLLSLIFVPSSNAATVMLANLVSDNDEALFIKMMNDKAAELGMTNTQYYNATGATSASFEGYYLPEGIDPNGDNYSTARDLAILIYNMLQKYPDVVEFTRNTSYTVHPGQPSEESFDSYLISLPGAKYGIDGFDGLKSGSSPSAGFGYVGTAKRGELRLIEVVLGVGDWSDQLGEEERHPIGNALLEHVFDGYEYKQVLGKGEQEVKGETVILDTDLYAFTPKGQEPTYTLEDGQLKVNSDLNAISPLVPEAKVAIQLPKQVAKKEAKKKQKAAKQAVKSPATFIKTYGISLVIILIGLFFTTVSRLFKAPTRGQRHASANSAGGQIGLIFGLVLIVIGLGTGILTYVGLISF